MKKNIECVAAEIVSREKSIISVTDCPGMYVSITDEEWQKNSFEFELASGALFHSLQDPFKARSVGRVLVEELKGLVAISGTAHLGEHPA